MFITRVVVGVANRKRACRARLGVGHTGWGSTGLAIYSRHVRHVMCNDAIINTDWTRLANHRNRDIKNILFIYLRAYNIFNMLSQFITGGTQPTLNQPVTLLMRDFGLFILIMLFALLDPIVQNIVLST